jgi:hypothetical protein
VHFYPEAAFSKFMEGETADIAVSVFTVTVFILPVLTSILFNFPKKNMMKPEMAESAEDVLNKS